MYASYSYGHMKFRNEIFNKTYIRINHPGEYTYSAWRSCFEGCNAREWNALTSHFAEDFQLAIVRAVTVTGIFCLSWGPYVFEKIAKEQAPFQDITKLYLQGKLDADCHYFVEKLVLEASLDLHYPCVCPEWLFAYGYSQKQYLSDLANYWDNIADSYYRPWETTRFGEDSPELVRLKKLGQQARSEIDQVARHSKKYLKREGGR